MPFLGNRNLPVDALALELIGVADVEVVPADADRRLRPFDRRRRRLDRVEVAGGLELAEELDRPRRDVVERAAVGQRGGVDARVGANRLRRVAVQRDLALVLRLEQIRVRLAGTP